MVKRIPACAYNDEEFIELQAIKNSSGLSWDRFVAKAILEYGKNHSGIENEEAPRIESD